MLRFKGRLLREEGTFIKEWKPRLAILENGVLNFYKGVREAEGNAGKIDLQGASVSEGDTDMRFKITRGSKPETFVIIKDSEHNYSAADWILAVNHHIEYANTGIYPAQVPTFSWDPLDPNKKGRSRANSLSVDPAAAANRGRSNSLNNPSPRPDQSPTAPNFSYPGGVPIAPLTVLEEDTTTYESSSSQYSYPSINNVTTALGDIDTAEPTRTSTGHNSAPYVANLSLDPNKQFPQGEKFVVNHVQQMSYSQPPPPTQYTATSSALPSSTSLTPQYSSNTVPDLRYDSTKWFQYYSKPNSEYLSKKDIITNLTSTYPSLSETSAESMVEAVWYGYCAKENNQIIHKSEFIKPSGLADMIIYQLPKDITPAPISSTTSSSTTYPSISSPQNQLFSSVPSSAPVPVPSMESQQPKYTYVNIFAGPPSNAAPTTTSTSTNNSVPSSQMFASLNPTPNIFGSAPSPANNQTLYSNNNNNNNVYTSPNAPPLMMTSASAPPSSYPIAQPISSPSYGSSGNGDGGGLFGAPVSNSGYGNQVPMVSGYSVNNGNNSSTYTATGQVFHGSVVSSPAVPTVQAYGTTTTGSTSTVYGSIVSPPPSSSYNQPPLPPGWEEMRMPDGKCYYVDHIGKRTTWVRPTN